MHATLMRRRHPLAHAHASALITLPSGAAASVPLVDDGSGEDEQAGDGLFTGVFTGTTEVGNYQVAIVGSGHYRRGPFRRQVQSSIHVPPALGAIGDDITDFRDTSGNAPSPQFLIDLPVTVPSPGPYFVDVTIQDALGTEIGLTEHVDLPAGESRVRVGVTGFALFAFSSNGPYTVTFIRVVSDVDPRIPVAVRSTPYTTAPYSILDFGYDETPGTPELALTTQSVVDVGDGRVLWTGLLTNVGDGSVRVGVVEHLGVRLPAHSKGTIANFASRLPGFARDVQPNQSVQVSAILTPDKKVKRVTFVVRGVISDGRGDVHRVVARASAKMP